jgi:hypothetical protein
MLKVTVEDVALTPATVPLSKSMPVVKPVEEAQVTTYPVMPPETEPPPPVWSETQVKLPEESLCRILALMGRLEGQKYVNPLIVVVAAEKVTAPVTPKVEPTFTLPPAVTVRKEVPLDDATMSKFAEGAVDVP